MFLLDRSNFVPIKLSLCLMVSEKMTKINFHLLRIIQNSEKVKTEKNV